MHPRHDPTSVGCDQQHADEPAAPGGTGARHWVLRWLAAAALVVSLTGATGYLGWTRYQRYEVDVAATQALDAAQVYALRLANFDVTTIDEHFAAVHEGSTGDLLGRHVKHHQHLRQLFVDNQVTAHGDVVDAAVKSATPNKVVVLVLVDQVVTNRAFPDPQIDRSRLRMTMDKVDGRWLASKAELA